jgi:hypothetical protein
MIRREPIEPPFPSTSQLLPFCLLVAAVLAVPLFLRARHLPEHRDRLATASVTAGPYAYLQREIYDESGDIDLLFAGDSVVWTGIDTPAVQARLAGQLGRPARALTLGWVWPGHDLLFYVLRDLLEHRRVHQVVLRLWPGEMLNVPPHPQSHRWLVACQHDPVLPVLPLPERAMTYGIEVVGGLRNLLSLVRPDQTGPSIYRQTLGHKVVETALGGPFRRFEPPVPALSREALEVRTRWPASIRVVDQTLAPYQAGYARAIRDLLEAHGVKVTLLRFPARSEVRAPVVDVAGYATALYQGQARVVAPRPGELFEGLSDDELRAMYYNDDYHLNANGAAFFTAAIMPALLDAEGSPPP